MELFFDEDYKEPPKENQGYFKMPDEKTYKIRILSKAITGWQDWTLERKPLRFPLNQKPKPIDPKKKVKHFWTMILWDYSDCKIKIIEITSEDIKNQLKSLINNESWGLPFHYDLNITRTGKQLQTKYTITPSSHRPVDPSIIDEFKKTPIWLEALYTGEDPFSTHHLDRTPGFFEKSEQKTDKPIFAQEKVNKISKEQAEALKETLKACGTEYEAQVRQYLVNKFNVHSLEETPLDIYDKIKESASKKLEAMQTDEVPF